MRDLFLDVFSNLNNSTLQQKHKILLPFGNINNLHSRRTVLKIEHASVVKNIEQWLWHHYPYHQTHNTFSPYE